MTVGQGMWIRTIMPDKERFENKGFSLQKYSLRPIYVLRPIVMLKH
jgi:hypothetical protein